MTLSEIQNQIALHLDFNPFAPSSTGTDYVRRTGIINMLEREWARQKDFQWNVLLKETTLPTVANQSYIDLPSDFDYKNICLTQDGHIKIGSNWYRLIKKSQTETYPHVEYTCYITGNKPQGYKLNISPTPAEVLDVELAYYTDHLAVNSGGNDISVLSSEDDETKCPDPSFLVFGALAFLYKTDGEGTLGLDFERQKEEAMRDMIAAENKGASDQENLVISMGEISGYPGIGEWR